MLSLEDAIRFALATARRERECARPATPDEFRNALFGYARSKAIALQQPLTVDLRTAVLAGRVYRQGLGAKGRRSLAKTMLAVATSLFGKAS